MLNRKETSTKTNTICKEQLSLNKNFMLMWQLMSYGIVIHQLLSMYLHAFQEVILKDIILTFHQKERGKLWLALRRSIKTILRKINRQFSFSSHYKLTNWHKNLIYVTKNTNFPSVYIRFFCFFLDRHRYKFIIQYHTIKLQRNLSKEETISENSSVRFIERNPLL